METAIIIPVHNRKAVTLRCLRALFSGASHDFDVIVVDSGSVDGTGEAVRRDFPDVIVIHGLDTEWWAGAVNRGIRYALGEGYKYIITYNDDNLSDPADIQNFIARAGGRNAIISATVCDLHDKHRVLFAGRKKSSITDRYVYMDLDKTLDRLGAGLREVDLLHGMCTLFPAEVFRDAGLFDERNFPHLFADDDLVLRSKEYNYRLYVDLDTVVYNDSREKGLNPYSKRLWPGDIARLFGSRKSAFQLSTRTHFLWRHRGSFGSFALTWLLDYTRLIAVILLRWTTTDSMYRKVEQRYMEFMARI